MQMHACMERTQRHPQSPTRSDAMGTCITVYVSNRDHACTVWRTETFLSRTKDNASTLAGGFCGGSPSMHVPLMCVTTGTHGGGRVREAYDGGGRGKNGEELERHGECGSTRGGRVWLFSDCVSHVVTFPWCQVCLAQTTDCCLFIFWCHPEPDVTPPFFHRVSQSGQMIQQHTL